MAAVAQAVGSAFQLAGSIWSGKAQMKAGAMEQEAYDYNAFMAIEKGKQEQEASERKFSALMGEQRSLYAKAGVDISSGSPLLVMADTAMREREEAQRIKQSAESEATLLRKYGKIARFTGRAQGISTILSGIGESLQGAGSQMKH
jgi:hypothetical protein